VLVAPGESRVIALEPEFIQPQDGHAKQDCERNAGKRWLARQAQQLAGHRVTLLGDDLYCNQPFCEAVLAQKLNFIFTCKPASSRFRFSRDICASHHDLNRLSGALCVT
jgi:hypothetical protein